MMPEIKKTFDRRAFLLLEVILTIVIITGGLLFVARTYSASKETLKRSSELFKTALLLEGKMFDFEESASIKEISDRGEFNDYKNYFWSVNASSIKDTGLNSVTLDVSREKYQGVTQYSIVTYLKKNK